MKFILVENRLDESKEDQLKLYNHVGQETADRFLKMKNSLKSPYNDIYYWLKQDKDALADYLDNTKGYKKRTGYQQELDRICASPQADDVEFICEQDGYKIYRIRTPEASVKWGLVVGGKADWCISGGYAMDDYDPEDNPEVILDQATRYFWNYLDDAYLRYYFVFGHGTKYAICERVDVGDCDVWDQHDNEIDKIPGLSPVTDKNGYLIYDDNFVAYTIFNTTEDGISIRIKDSVHVVKANDIFAVADDIVEVEIPNSVVIIDENAFSNCKHLEWVDMSDRIREIGKGAFDHCERLEDIHLSPYLKEIPEKAFRGCLSLATIRLPNFVEYINQSAFAGCTSLETISLPSRVLGIRDDAFRDCTSLETVRMDDYCGDIGKFAFAGCTSLKTITLPNYVYGLYIDTGAFSGCTSLKTLELPEEIDDIRPGAFDGCSSLTIKCHSSEVAELVKKSGFDGPIINMENGERIQ